MSPTQPQLGTRFSAVSGVKSPMRANTHQLREPTDGTLSPSSDSSSVSEASVETRPAQVGASRGAEVGMELLLAAAQIENSQTGDDDFTRLTDTIETPGDGNGSSGSVTSDSTTPTPYDDNPADCDVVHATNLSEGWDAAGVPGHIEEGTSLRTLPVLPIDLPENSELPSGGTMLALSYGCLQQSTGLGLVSDLPRHGIVEPQVNQEQNASGGAGQDSWTKDDKRPFAEPRSPGIELDLAQGFGIDDIDLSEYLVYSPSPTT